MTGNRLLDTNAAIALLNKSPDVARVLRSSDRLFLPLIVLGELEAGAHKSARLADNLSALENLLKESVLLSPDRRTASIYGEIHFRLRKKGRPIPLNDIWIAAIALQHSLPLLTRDRHFEVVDGITLATW